MGPLSVGLNNYSTMAGLFAGLKPEPRLTVSEWADQHRFLSPKASAEPGKWRTPRVPYLKEVQDNLSSLSPFEEIIGMKGAQLGWTEAGCNWLGYIIDAAPGPILAVQTTEKMARRYSKTRFDSMVLATPRLRNRIKPARVRDGGNTTMEKDFDGGVIAFAGANSASALRSMPVRYLFLDEVDAYPLDLDGEGSPVDLAKARTRTFSKKKIFLISTPTVDSISVIQREFLSTDQRYYFVPCPHCDHKQTLVWKNMKWDAGKPDSVRYMCEECACLIEERFKTVMLEKGEWKATHPENASPIKVGYHINSLYSPYGWYSWAEAVKEWEEAQGDTPKLKAFVNTVLGETWKDKGEAPPWENLFNRRETYAIRSVPQEVCFLTCGADVQKDRIELEIVGWAKGKKSYSIDYRVLRGDTSAQDVWGQLGTVLNETFIRADNLQMPIRLTAVDSGFNTQEVYDFCLKFGADRAIPTRGQDKQAVMISAPKQVLVTRAGKKVGGVGLWNIGVSLIKSELYGWLRLEIGEDGIKPKGYCTFPQYDQHHFKGLASEEMQLTVDKRGRRRYEWVVKYLRNEQLDCRVYARAAAAVIGIDRFQDEHYEKIAGSYSKKSENKPKKKRDSFW